MVDLHDTQDSRAIYVAQIDGLPVYRTTDDGTDTMYIQKIDANGNWYIIKRTYGTSPSTNLLEWASEKNNSGTSDDATAWTNRASLTYGKWYDAVSAP